MRIDENLKEKLREIPILQVAEALDIVVRGKAAHCFMHDDQHPSLGFHTNKNTWYCYVCGKGGDVIALVMEKLGLPYVEACKWLADRFGLVVPEDDGVRMKVKPRQTRAQRMEAAQRREEEAVTSVDAELLTWIVEQAGLSPRAQEFLFDERHYDRKVVEQLNIGSVTDGRRLVEMLIEKFGRQRALASGIVRQHKERLFLFYYTPCLLLPYKDIDGKVVNLQSRYLGNKEGVPRFQFLEGTYTGIFNAPMLKEIDSQDELYLSEGATDCMALLSSGKKAIAVPSATLFHERDVKYLVSKRLLMYPDKDRAGERLYEKLTAALADYGTSIERLPLPEGCKDFSDCYVQRFNRKVQVQ